MSEIAATLFAGLAPIVGLIGGLALGFGLISWVVAMITKTELPERLTDDEWRAVNEAIGTMWPEELPPLPPPAICGWCGRPGPFDGLCPGCGGNPRGPGA